MDDFNNEPTKESFEEEQATIEHLDTLSLEDIDAELENDKIETPESDDEPKEEPKAEDSKDELPPDDSQQEDEPKEDELVVIDDDYINKASEEDKAILESIKGESLSPKMLKKHLSSEHATARFKGEKGDVVSKLKELEKQHEENRSEVLKPIVEQDDATKVDDLVKERLKAKYPDFPTTDEERSDMQIDNLDKYLDYKKAENDEKVFVQQQFEKTDFIQKNYSEINTNILNDDLAIIKDKLSNLGITQEELGISLEFDEQGKFKDERLDKLLLDNGKYDGSIIDTKYGVPLVKELAFARKFRDTFESEIYTAIKEKGMKEGAKGITDQSKLDGMSQMKPGTQQPFKDLEQKVDSMSMEDIEKELAK